MGNRAQLDYCGDRLAYELSPYPVSVMPREYSSNHRIPLHQHERHQLIFAVQGVMEIETCGGFWLVPPQRALLMPLGTPHRMRGRGVVSLRTAYLRSDVCSRALVDKPSEIQVSPLLHALLLRAAEFPLHYNSAGAEVRLFRVLVDEIEGAPRYGLRLPFGHDKRLERVCRALVEHPGDARSLEQWGSIVGASPRTLARLFKAELGTSFLIWRQQARLSAAIPRLAAGESVAVIAADLGYATAGAFAAMFRRLTGAPPSQLRPGRIDL